MNKKKGGAVGVENTFYQKYILQSPAYLSATNFTNRLFSEQPSDELWRTTVYKFFGSGIVLAIISISMFIMVLNPGFTAYNLDKYFFLLVLPLLLLFAFVLNIGSEASSNKAFMKVAVGLLLIGGVVYYYTTSQSSGILELGSNYALLALIGLIGITVLYNTLVQYMSKLTGWPGFIAQLIFFIPCILTDLWEALLADFQMTHYSIYLILFIEAFLIVLYFILPLATTSITGLDNGKQLLLKAVRLDKEMQIIANSGDLRIIPEGPDAIYGNVKHEFRKNYCISMWVYVTPQSSSTLAYTKETEIFKYGYTDLNGIEHVKPMLRYYGGGHKDIADERDKYIFYFTEYPPKVHYDDPENTSYEVTVPNQRWNNFVMNYNRNGVDIYINGNLERSFNLSGHLPDYNDLDQITVGSPDGKGVQGALCNVQYFNHPLSPEQIAFSYNMLFKSDPPIPRNPKNTR